MDGWGPGAARCGAARYGTQAFFLLGVDSHRYMSFLLDKPAKARGVRLICLDRPGRGRTSDFEDEK